VTAVDPDLDARLGAILANLGVPYERARPGAYLVTLNGEHRLSTMTWLVIGAHGLLVEAFFVRRPEENHNQFAGWLLAKNASTWGVHFAFDALGDVYLVGRLPLAAINEADIDRVLGCVLTYADESFDRALEIGFGSSIRREWTWRRSRGESTANLAAFARFAEVARSTAPDLDSRDGA
jgi:hypothetical protein